MPIVSAVREPALSSFIDRGVEFPDRLIAVEFLTSVLVCSLECSHYTNRSIVTIYIHLAPQLAPRKSSDAFCPQARLFLEADFGTPLFETSAG